jgi:hypothetical protein
MRVSKRKLNSTDQDKSDPTTTKARRVTANQADEVLNDVNTLGQFSQADIQTK